MSVPDVADLLQALAAEILHALADIAAAGIAEEAVGLRAVLQAPDDEAASAERRQEAARFTEEDATEADALIFRTEIDLVNLAFLRQSACAGKAESGVAGNDTCNLDDEKRGGATGRLAPPIRIAPVDHLVQRAVGDKARIGV